MPDDTQLDALRRLLAMLPDSRFYRNKLAGIDPAVASLDDFSRRFPFTTKQELIDDQLAAPPYGTNLPFPLAAYTRFHQTSGTTRAPLRCLDTPESWSWMVESWKVIYQAAEVVAADRIYFAFSFGPFMGFWLAFDAAQRMGCLCIPGGGIGSQGRLQAMIENSATVLCCTPSYAIRLAEVAAVEGIDLRRAGIRKLIVAGEPGGSIPSTRRRIMELWPGARVFDHHGMTETGPVTFECPVQAGTLHVIESAYIAEVIGAAEAGAPGELVLTPLGRTGFPLLRYRTGDLVRAVSVPCACGHGGLSLQGGILGRTDDMLVVRGVNIYPSAVENILRGFGEVAEYQVRVDKSRSLAELAVHVEAQRDCSDTGGLVKRLEERFHAVFNLRVPVVLAPAGTLPRFEMKARRWIV